MPGSGTGHAGGGGHSGGGHSGGFSGGGHSSGHIGGLYSNSGRYTSPEALGNQFPEGGDPNGQKRRFGCSSPIAAIFIVVVVVFTVLASIIENAVDKRGYGQFDFVTALSEEQIYNKDGTYIPGSTCRREPFTGESENIGKQLTDEAGVVDNSEMLERSLAYFTQLTGVYVHLFIPAFVNDSEYPDYSEVEDFGLKTYKKLFGDADESHLLVTCFLYPYGSYYCVPTYGYDIVEVLDDEAREILMYSIDYFIGPREDYSTGLDDAFTDAFYFAANRIMNGASEDITERFSYVRPSWLSGENSSQDMSGTTAEMSEVITAAENTSEEISGQTSAELTTEKMTEATDKTSAYAEKTEPLAVEATTDGNEESGGFTLNRNMLIILLVAIGFVAAVVAVFIMKKTDGDGDDGSYKRTDSANRNENPYDGYFDPDKFEKR